MFTGSLRVFFQNSLAKSQAASAPHCLNTVLILLNTQGVLHFKKWVRVRVHTIMCVCGGGGGGGGI